MGRSPGEVFGRTDPAPSPFFQFPEHDLVLNRIRFRTVLRHGDVAPVHEIEVEPRRLTAG
jgi:hypothetical protein